MVQCQAGAGNPELEKKDDEKNYHVLEVQSQGKKVIE